MELEVKLLFEIVEEITGIDKDTMLSGSRKAELIDAKRIMGVVLSKHTDMRMWQIGEKLGGLDHSCICNYKKTYYGIMENDKKFKNNFLLVESIFVKNIGIVEFRLLEMLEERKKVNKEMSRLRKVIKIKQSN